MYSTSSVRVEHSDQNVSGSSSRASELHERLADNQHKAQRRLEDDQLTQQMAGATAGARLRCRLGQAYQSMQDAPDQRRGHIVITVLRDPSVGVGQTKRSSSGS